MASALRVLQAADLNLHEPLEFAGRLPAGLQEIFNQARERSALKIFTTALAEQVDLLLLTGTLADFEAEPRLACFLVEQFRRLHRAGVSVVWVTEKSSLLPIWSLRPEHLVCLLPGQTTVVNTLATSQQVVVHHAASKISTSKAATDFRASSRDLVIAVTPSGGSPHVEYIWRHESQAVQYALTPVQPDSLHEQTSHGIRSTVFMPGQPVRSMLSPVAAVTWGAETIDLSGHFYRESLLEEMSQRCRLHRAASRSEMTCLEWILTGDGPVWDDLVSENHCDQLLQQLRNREGRDSLLWNWKIRMTPASAQFQHWGKSAAVSEGLRQLDLVTQADLEASEFPAGAGLHLRGPVGHRDLAGQRLRLVRELRSPSGTNDE